jgi:hypothetical protein
MKFKREGKPEYIPVSITFDTQEEFDFMMQILHNYEETRRRKFGPSFGLGVFPSQRDDFVEKLMSGLQRVTV